MSQETLFEAGETEHIADEVDDHRSAELWKRWYRSRTGGGFISIRPWVEVGKLLVEIGELGSDTKLKGATGAWCGAIPMAVYCRAVASDTETKLYKDGEFVVYGGSRHKDHGPVSRILKVQPNGKGGFFAKAGLFEAEVSGSGAFTPKDTSKFISMNSIQLSRVELAEISYRLDLTLTAYATNNLGWSVLTGKR